MSRLKVANLTYRVEKGPTARVDETTLTGLILEDLGDKLFGLISRLCNNNWSYEVRWGPKDPDCGVADHSLGHQLFNLAQWVANWGYGRRVKVAEFPADPDSKWVKEAGWPWDGSDAEENL